MIRKMARSFAWFPPEKIVDLLIDQRQIKPSVAVTATVSNVGSSTLLVTPQGTFWLVEVVDRGVPSAARFFHADSGASIPAAEIHANQPLAELFTVASSLSLADDHGSPAKEDAGQPSVARVISGDSWSDPRPARPVDFVGRSDLLTQIPAFIKSVSVRATDTRVFSVEGPSGLGKSSLVLKLAQVVSKRTYGKIVMFAVDTRSATNSLFVNESLRLALAECRSRRLISKRNQLTITNSMAPLSSPEVLAAIDEIRSRKGLLVLFFDQFEELFAKPNLFETFEQIRRLSLAVDSEGAPIALGFAWKTDFSLPQDHPAYYLWHELADRRKGFKIHEFRRKDILDAIRKAEASLHIKLMPAIKVRLAEQCQGLPWLLKKLLVHIVTVLDKVDSQYKLLERELDIEKLFKEDLDRLTKEQIDCLRYVAGNSPAAIPIVESSFSTYTTNALIQAHLLVRSGMNYNVYWDIFRDYLKDGKVPSIPWSRSFQREPATITRVLSILSPEAKSTLQELASAVNISVASCQNIMTDLIALQLANSVSDYVYTATSQVDVRDPEAVATYVASQLRKHVVYRALCSRYDKNQEFSHEDWNHLFQNALPRTAEFTPDTIQQYAQNLKKWFAYAGLIRFEGSKIKRPQMESPDLQYVVPARPRKGVFLGTSGYQQVLKLLALLSDGPRTIKELSALGLRNAVQDAHALSLVENFGGSKQRLKRKYENASEMQNHVKSRLLEQESILAALECMAIPIPQAATELESRLDLKWKPTSATRNVNGLRRFARWATGQKVRSRRKQAKSKGKSPKGAA